VIAAQFIFWFLASIVLYTYIGYGFILWLLGRKRPDVVPDHPLRLPRVAHIIAAYNEEEVIASKIQDSQRIDYPLDLITTIVIADGSTDRTTEIIRQHRGVILLFQPAREGKVAAMNRAVATVQDADILIFSDANTSINPDAFKRIVAHYQDPKVGGVAGEKRVIAHSDVPGKAESIYWRYESILKQLGSNFHTVVGAAGELFSVRRQLFVPVPEHVLLDDLFISLSVCKKGLLIRYEPHALASEAPSLSIDDERTRRIRISAGAFQALAMFRDLLNLLKYGKLSFQYISHRVLRWTICPVALPLIYLTNAYLMWITSNPLYIILFIMQTVFYILAGIGALLVKKKKGGSIFLLPYYFVFMNYSILEGLKRYLSGTQSVRWEKSKRAVLR
jgi:poly-beta-1,6-N-acetyl-D-glucosamine synthase